MIRQLLVRSLAVVTLACLPATLLAQAYPNRPVRLVVTFAAGGSADLVARAVNQPLSAALGQPVVIDNRPGAGGTLGANLVAQAEPDGYTLLFSATGPNAIAPGLQKNLAYDPVKSFAGISRISIQPAIIVVNADVAARSVNDLIALAKASPGKLNFASPGQGTSSHLGGELFKMLTGVQIEHIPYKDGRLAVTDLVSGRIGIMFDNIGTFLPHIRAGKLRALAIAAGRRSPLLAETPTAAEAGLAGYEYSIWFGISAPANTPAPIVALLNAKVAEALKAPVVTERLAVLNAEVSTSTPAETDRFVASEIQKWGNVIRSAGLAAQ
jgi:tripartite-type tricarboxylate transporter receptor subunit TctC